jgi:hypothetical protein
MTTDFDRPITVNVSYNDGLSLRIACSSHGAEWRDRASAHRAKGENVDADTCNRIADGYSRLWSVIEAAMKEPCEACKAPAPTGRLAIRLDNLRWEDRDGESDA